ncbi:MAG TPA: radical SAM protein [Blastocatellia bacterium]|nr:radical SAM protein [Blastocatellia bacterium]
METAVAASRVIVTAKASALVISVEGRYVFSFDRAGRLYMAYRDGRTIVRGLDHTMIEKWRPEGDPAAPRLIRTLGESEKDALIEEIRATVKEIGDAVARRSEDVTLLLTAQASSPEDVIAWLERISAWDATAYRADRRRFLSVYRPVSIMPPDQYLALALQITEGCHWNRCTFCDFYRDRRFRIKTISEVRTHIRDVKAFFGDSIALRRRLFLADANALILPQEKLLPIFDLLHEEFPIGSSGSRTAGDGYRFDGIYSFIDTFSGTHKRVDDFVALRQRHLRRVYLGVESGDDELLRWVQKPGTAAGALQIVRTLKAAGVAVGVIILVGLGGRRFFTSHVEKSVELLNAMPLDGDDIIYLSPLWIPPHSDYERQARADNVAPLDYAELKQQIALLRAGLRYSRQAARPKISIYDVREFIY